jgi:hypothetical protein
VSSRDSAVTYRSQGLQALLNALPADRCARILDLGPALHSNVNFWSRHPCVLYIEDFYRARTGSPEETGVIRHQEFLEYEKNLRFDVILAWDLFNYFNLEELASLAEKLESRCQPQSMLFVMASSQLQIPSLPMQFRILDEERIEYRTCTETVAPCPRHHPHDLGRILPNFQISHSYLLRNGVQEYIFTHV